MLLRKFSGFNKFIRLNNIDEPTLQKAAELLEIREVNKGEYFLHEGEPSKFFAGLIKGKISFRKSKIINRETNEIVLKHLFKVSLLRKPTIGRQIMKSLTSVKSNDEENKENNKNLKKIINNVNTSKSGSIKIQQRLSIMPTYKALKSHFSLIKNNYSSKEEYRVIKENFDPKKYIVLEEELFQAGGGYCFGEWALIYNQPRSASVFTLEDCIFFTLDEKYFSKTFLKCLNNSEYKKKKFVMENLFPFDIFNDRKSSIYKNIIPINCERNQIIFNEGDIADTIYIIYLGTFILEKKYKHKTFNVLSLEKGSIVGLESIFEEDRKYKCTLKLTSYDELGIIFSCNIHKLVPYLINKMKEAFKNNYLLYLKTSEEFYLKNINIQQKIFFKKRNENNEEKKDIINLNIINSKRNISLKNLNKDNKKSFLLNKNKTINTIKFRNSKQIKIDSFPFLNNMINTTNQQSNNKNLESLQRSNSRAMTTIKNNRIKGLKLNKLDINDKYIRKKSEKRMKTSFNILPIKQKLDLNIDNDNDNNNNNDKNKDENRNKSIDNENGNGNDNDNDEKKEESKNIGNKKYIEGYTYKNNYNNNHKIRLNGLSNINHVDSIYERIDKIINPISTCDISNNNEFKKEKSQKESSFKTIKSSFNKLFQKTLNDSKNFEINNKIIKNDDFQFKDRIIKHKKRLGYNLLSKNENINQLSYKVLFSERDEKGNLNITPIKFQKNSVNIKKYVNFLLSYKNVSTIPKNLENILKNKEKNIIRSEKKNKKKRNINIFKKNKSENKNIKSRNINNEFNFNELNQFNTINNSKLSYTKNNLFTFNSGSYELPLMSQIINKTKNNKS